MRTLADTIIYQDPTAVHDQIKKTHDINIIDEYGFTPLIEAIIMNKPDIAYLLLEKGADPNFVDTTHRTALMWACDNHQTDLCETLLSFGAHPNYCCHTGQSALVLPLLRKQENLKELLIRHGADVDLALNFIHAKLIGHRFALTGKVHITAPNQSLIVVDFEGFMLEFTLMVIYNSLDEYQHNYASRDMGNYFKFIEMMTKSFQNAIELVRLQHYQVNIKEHETLLTQLLNESLLLLPVVYEGHAITFVKHGHWLAKCDRGANSKQEGSVNVYRINAPDAANHHLWKTMLYQKNQASFFHKKINMMLNLEPVYQVPISPQITGNCSWANTEAAIPVMLFLLKLEKNERTIDKNMGDAMNFYQMWLNWDKERALHEYINRYPGANSINQASITSILAAVFFRMMQDNPQEHEELLKRILPILKTPNYFYITHCYLKQFHQKNPTKVGKQLKSMLETYKIHS